MDRAALARIAAVLAALFGAAGCAQSRGHDTLYPEMHEIDPAAADADVIPYRTLTRDDFRASEPPPSFAAYRGRVGAATCAYFRTSPRAQLDVQPSTSPRLRDEPRYDSILRNFAVESVMSRSCSWWNADQKGVPPDYILQHEQIHFALYELAARRFNAGVSALARHCSFAGPEPNELIAKTRACVREAIDAAAREALDENRRFDEDTSFAHDPDKQRAWWARVERELAVPVAGAP